jgi:tetratricopeptide (TPR) repeat protein
MLEGPGDGEYLKEALTIFERLGDLRRQAAVCANLGFVCAYAGRWNEGVKWLTSARDQYTYIGDVVRAADPALNLGEMLVKQRRYDEAEPVLRDAIRVLRAAHFTEGVNRAEIQLSRILIERGMLAEAESMLERVQREFVQAGQPVAALEAAVMRAAALLRAARAADALTLLDEAMKRAGRDAQLLLPLVATERGPILAALGRTGEAVDVVADGIAAAEEQGLPYEKALLQLIKGELASFGGTSAEPAELRAAKSTLDALGVIA